MIKKTIWALALLTVVACKSKTNSVEQHTDANGYTYETVKDDPTGMRLYTLENGLKVYLSQNNEEPKIQTYIAVRAGSNYDPQQSTGLAHYLEHMLFKGTSKIGTIDWEKEKAYLAQISDLYEQHRAEADPAKKAALYHQIDSISYIASGYAVANEYDKMISSLGATGTNAHTWMEETIYKNKIPANELKKWLHVESERFGELVLRLFHTELEAVFEEFNRGQDNDGRKQFSAMLEGLFPNHPYGQQTTIGTAEHLKNPSMVDIHNYFDTYYVPNNMAVVLVGDLEFDETIKAVDESFGKMERKEVNHPELPKEEPITAPVVKEVFGPTAEGLMLAFRTDAIGSEEAAYVTLVDMILSNGQVGLIDINLNQNKAVQGAYSSTIFQNDYGMHYFGASPLEGQDLEEAKDLILAQIDSIKAGNFDDWMIEAVINDMKLSENKSYENSTALASKCYNAFIHREEWKDKVGFVESLRKINKEQLVKFANDFYKDNYVLVYKRQGVDTTIAKVENPGITPVQLNRDTSSQFIRDFEQMEVEPISPQFISYDEKLNRQKLNNGVEVAAVENTTNDLFDFNFILDMGSNHNKKLSLAVNYLDYIGTENYSAEELKKEFYKLGVGYYVYAADDITYIGLNGINENFDKGLVLLKELLSNAKADSVAYEKYVASILKSRKDAKANKGSIFYNGLLNFAKYGPESKARDIYSAEELAAINPEELVALVKSLGDYKQRIMYYGNDLDQAMAALNKEFTSVKEFKAYPEEKKYEKLNTGGQVFFANYDMVQCEMMFVAKADSFRVADLAATYLFNTYFGSGLSSIVFQEIRESKSLAYSAYASYQLASEKNDVNYVGAYIGTQANKIDQATDAMLSLMHDMPLVEQQFNAAKEATIKKMNAKRITKSSIFWSYENLVKRGLENVDQEAIYNQVKSMTMEDLKAFFDERIKNNQYNVIVIGNEKDVNLKALSKLGEVHVMDLETLFNY